MTLRHMEFFIMQNKCRLLLAGSSCCLDECSSFDKGWVPDFLFVFFEEAQQLVVCLQRHAQVIATHPMKKEYKHGVGLHGMLYQRYKFVAGMAVYAIATNIIKVSFAVV